MRPTAPSAGCRGRLTGAAALVLLIVLAGCTGSVPPVTPPQPHATARAAVPVAAPGPARPSTPGDLSKLAAVAFVERIGSWEEIEPGAGSDRVIAAGYPASLLAVAPQLVDLPTHRSRTRVVFAQQGGLTSTAASVIVLAEQQWGDVGHGGIRQLILDVRLVPFRDGWHVTAVADPPRPRPAPARPGGPTTVGRSVLDDPAISLPEPARRDIVERRVDDPILTVLMRLGSVARIDVQVAVTGHPGTVFPTPRLSNHAVGRAFDIRAVDGVAVEDLRDDPRLLDLMVAAGDAGATEVGGPIAVAGSGYFTDDVHRDHLHVGITPGRPTARAEVR